MATGEVHSTHQRVPRSVLVLALLATAGRLALGALLIVVMLSFVPSSTDGSMVVPVVVALFGALLYAYFFRRQLRKITRSRFPTLMASEALVLLAALFLGVFAMIYVAISLSDATAFTEPLDAFTSYYFALTVLATVGFGDITPVTTLARSFTMVQMALDLVFIAVLIRIVSSAARKGIGHRATETASGQGAGSSG
jgi:voltage-gated potassium channel